MGRHSRKGRAKAGDPSARAVGRGSAPPWYGMAPGDTATRPTPPRPPEPRDEGPGGRGPSWEEGAYGPTVRGGHPELREPGGGWGADGTGRGPAAGQAAGRVLQGTPGAAAPQGQQTGPRQEYLDAFDDFAGHGTGAVQTPAPRHPTRHAGPPHGRGPDTRRPGTPGPWNGYGQPVGFGPEQAARDPWQRQARGQGPGQGSGQAPGRPGQGPGFTQGGLPVAPRASAPAEAPPTKGGKGRAVTGVIAAAVTTVLAVVIGGQVAGGGSLGDSGEAGSADTDRGQLSGEGPASRSDDDGRGAPGGAPRGAAPPTYAEKMGQLFSLDPRFKGEGSFTAVKGNEKGSSGGQVMRYRVDVEDGLPLESGLFAQAVHKTLNDKRSWAHEGERSFERVEGDDADFVITLASAPTTDVWCAKSGLDTSEDRVSCDSASTERIMINAYRWAQGAKTFGDDRMFAYRQMLINHEVGHRIGFNHVGCSEDGALAPVMMQQTKTLKSGGATCKPNAWPFPRG